MCVFLIARVSFGWTCVQFWPCSMTADSGIVREAAAVGEVRDVRHPDGLILVEVLL